MRYRDKLKQRIIEVNNNICMGMDPVLDRIPLKGLPEENIKRFYSGILEAMTKRGVFPAAVKPNIAFFEAVSIDCLHVLKDLIAWYKKADILVILDAKRGDIGKTSAAYAAAAFEIYRADAVTVAPYMGFDSVKPFQEASKGQGIYILTRTSNPGAADFQSRLLQDPKKRLYELVAEKISDWDDGNLGAVAGATAPREFENLLKCWKDCGREIPCLIPGISIKGVKGGQGGSLEDMLAIIDRVGGDRNLHLVNSSSGINYAHENQPGVHWAEASINALEELTLQFSA